MLKNINASLGGRNLSNITQVRKVLQGLVQGKEILYFEKISNRLDRSISVSYNIFLKSNLSFHIVIRPAMSFNPIKGAEWGTGREDVVLVDKNCNPRRIKEIIREIIKIHKDGFDTEESCHKDIDYLIKNDKEVARKIKGITLPTLQEDKRERKDRFLEGVNNKRVPLQIKKAFVDSQKHKENKYPIPLIHYRPDLLKSGLLKQYILRIFDSYPEYIEYCI
ncbi:MAG: hypothetical protein KBB16_00230 [Candidatus Pacebacteria bacterium]|nr:hypothetical protein [Candidatus Paceibacterota bacterium]